MTPEAKTIKKNTNSTQNKSQTHRAKQYEVTSFLSRDCELSTATCSKNVYSLGPCTYTYVTDFAIEIWGFYRRLTDTLRYHHTRCSHASGLPGIHCIRCLLIGRKVEFVRSCPLFLASFGKLRLSDQVQFIAWHGIQRRIIWIFCRESEVPPFILS